MTLLESLQSELVPQLPAWSASGAVDASFWRVLAQHDTLGQCRKAAPMRELCEVARTLVGALGIGAAASYAINEIAVSLIMRVDPTRSELLQSAVRGELRAALCITEAESGSDVAGIETRALREDTTYCLRGSKQYIANAPLADSFVVACKTSGAPETSWRDISLVLVERSNRGLTIGPTLRKVGAELLPLASVDLHDCLVDARAVLGSLGRGFVYLMEALAFERLVVAALASEATSVLLERTIARLHQRAVFGRPLADRQVLRHALTRLHARSRVVSSFVWMTIDAYDRKTCSDDDVLVAKLSATELFKESAATCPQFFGAAGFAREEPVSLAFEDARWTAIAAGANELLFDVLSNRVFGSAVLGH
ncbi:MAG: putative acyl coenzyme dehydrogenase (HcaD-like) protein [Myxococcaceae bacterium]|nr:putative acyl coenzyme dehydrogenase (HcaD-like) protein [Myxococcaceae bacterium]